MLADAAFHLLNRGVWTDGEPTVGNQSRYTIRQIQLLEIQYINMSFFKPCSQVPLWGMAGRFIRHVVEMVDTATEEYNLVYYSYNNLIEHKLIAVLTHYPA